MKRLDCDLLVLGGGLGGLAAATRAHALGLDTLVLEKSQLVGGVAAYSGGVVWVGNNHTMPAGSDSIEEAEAYLDFANGEGVPFDRALRRGMIETAAEAVRWFDEEAGIPFADTGLHDQYWPHGPGSKESGRILEVAVPGGELGEWQARSRPSPHFRVIGMTQREVHDAGGDLEAYRRCRDLLRRRQADDHRTYGYGLAAGFIRAALVDRGVRCELGARTLELIQQGGEIVGARAILDGDETEIRAGAGVLVATGSYGSAAWAAGAEGLPELHEASPPVLDGDGLALTDPTPAAIVRAGQAFTLLGYAAPGETHPGTDVPLHRQVFENVGFPHSLIVNGDGRRFGDESFYGYFVQAAREWDPQRKRFANWPCWLVVDDRFRRQYPFGPFDPGDAWPDEIPHASTLRELAERIGVDADGLAATVERFNAHARAGADPDFGRGSLAYARARLGDPEYANPNLGPLEEPPFWGLRMSLIGAGIYSMGLSVDRHGRCLTRAGEPVPGLYATGNAVAYTEQPGYVGGLGNVRNIAYGYAAATHAAGRSAPATAAAARARDCA